MSVNLKKVKKITLLYKLQQSCFGAERKSRFVRQEKWRNWISHLMKVTLASGHRVKNGWVAALEVLTVKSKFWSYQGFCQACDMLGSLLLQIPMGAFIVVHDSPSTNRLTCLFSVIAPGWHFVQIPPGQGGCSVHPGLILQLVSSSTVNLPLKYRTSLLINW